MVNDLIIPDGYVLHGVDIKVPLEAARRILLSKKQHRYSFARREGDEAVLSRYILVCPACGHRQSATRRCILGEKTERIHKQEVERWACEAQQMALWDDGFLALNEVLRPQRWECPRCGTVHRPERERVMVSVAAEKKKIKIVCRGMHTGQRLAEGLEFNLRKGRIVFTQLKLWEGKRVIRVIRDVTDLPSWLRETYTFQMLEKNIRLRKVVYRCLRSSWDKPLPYRFCGFGTEMLFVMCRFVGYPRSFYESIPWSDSDGLQIHPHFLRISRRLHDSRKLAHTLAQIKPLWDFRAVRRLFAEQPGLLFYYREATALLETMRWNPSGFCSLLRGRHGVFLLSEIAAYPGMMTFITDYLQVKGFAALCKELDKSAGVVRFYALEYHAMDSSRKALEQRAWKHAEVQFQPGPGFSIPLRLGDTRIDGGKGVYEFRYLRSTKEILEYGKRLNSVMGIFPEGTVVGITCRGEPVGAAQICENWVVHTEGSDNRPLPAQCWKAFEIWCKENGLRLSDEEDEGIYCF